MALINRINMPIVFVILVVFTMLPVKLLSATRADIDKLTTYSVILGRSVACGADIKVPMEKVGKWMDKRFTKASGDQKNIFTYFYYWH